MAVGEEPAGAEEARPAVDVEGDHHAVAHAQVLHRRADLVDDADELVAERVADAGVGHHPVVEVQVGAADGGQLDADDRVVGVLDRPVGACPRRGRGRDRGRPWRAWATSSVVLWCRSCWGCGCPGPAVWAGRGAVRSVRKIVRRRRSASGPRRRRTDPRTSRVLGAVGGRVLDLLGGFGGCLLDVCPRRPAPPTSPGPRPAGRAPWRRRRRDRRPRPPSPMAGIRADTIMPAPNATRPAASGAPCTLSWAPLTASPAVPLTESTAPAADSFADPAVPGRRRAGRSARCPSPCRGRRGSGCVPPACAARRWPTG